eukprot:352825-Chlamydomonas_euryale.AAC.8
MLSMRAGYWRQAARTNAATLAVCIGWNPPLPHPLLRFQSGPGRARCKVSGGCAHPHAVAARHPEPAPPAAAEAALRMHCGAERQLGCFAHPALVLVGHARRAAGARHLDAHVAAALKPRLTNELTDARTQHVCGGQRDAGAPAVRHDRYVVEAGAGVALGARERRACWVNGRPNERLVRRKQRVATRRG